MSSRRRTPLFELVNCSYIVGFDERAVVARGAGQFGSSILNIVVAWAVGCGRKLFEKFKVCEGTRVNRCLLMVLAKKWL